MNFSKNKLFIIYYSLINIYLTIKLYNKNFLFKNIIIKNLNKI